MGKMPFNWFDILVVVVLLLGAWRGRKHGMSQEFIPLLKWVALVLVCGLVYAPLAAALAGGTMLGALGAAFTAYLAWRSASPSCLSSSAASSAERSSAATRSGAVSIISACCRA
jgi:hypothetical protein